MLQIASEATCGCVKVREDQITKSFESIILRRAQSSISSANMKDIKAPVY